MRLPLFRNHVFRYFEGALVAFGAEGAPGSVHHVGICAVGAVGGVLGETAHDKGFVVAGQAGYGCGDGTEVGLAGSAREGRHCCGWGAAGGPRWWWWWRWGGVAIVCGSCGVVVGGWIQFGRWNELEGRGYIDPGGGCLRYQMMLSRRIGFV